MHKNLSRMAYLEVIIFLCKYDSSISRSLSICFNLHTYIYMYDFYYEDVTLALLNVKTRKMKYHFSRN